jgi:U3 small nucleolar RNA-associated protein 15
MSEFKKLVLKQFPAAAEPESTDSRYWKKFQNTVTIKEYGSVSYVNFSPIRPYDVAVTSGSRIQIYSSVNGEVKKTISKFKEAAYGGTFRNDGQLIAAGDKNGSVKVCGFYKWNIKLVTVKLSCRYLNLLVDQYFDSSKDILVQHM